MTRVKKQGTALVVIDMQRDFLEERGAGAAVGIWKHARDKQIIKNTKKAIEKARETGCPIVYVQTFFRHELLSDSAFPGAIKEMGLFKRGTPGAEIIEDLRPQPEDHIVEKHSMNAFYNTELEDVLKGLKCNTLIFTGIATNFCIETTVRAASDRGYNIVVLSDCIATVNEEAQGFPVNVIFPLLGEVTTAEELEIAS